MAAACRCACHTWVGVDDALRCGCQYVNPITDSTVDVPLPSLTAPAPRTFHRLLTEEENALIMHVRGHRHLSAQCQLCVATEALDVAIKFSKSCSHCGTALVAEDCPNYGAGVEHA